MLVLCHLGVTVWAITSLPTGLGRGQLSLPQYLLAKVCLSSEAVSLLPRTASFLLQLIHPSLPHSYCGFSESPFEDSPRQPPCSLTLSQNLQEHSFDTPEKRRDPLHCCPTLEVFFVLPGCAQEGRAAGQSAHPGASPAADTPPETR